MVTADTITDEQIRELRDSIPSTASFGSFAWQRLRECEWALIPSSKDVECNDRRKLARARCAEILNTRAKESR